MERKLSIIAMALTIMWTSNCASILTDSKRKVLFETEPPRAKVFVNGFKKGTTPVQLKVRAKNLLIGFSKVRQEESIAQLAFWLSLEKP